MIHVFHGFLGSAQDFDFLKSSNVVLHDLYQADLQQIIKQLTPEDVLIGYSMGGRIALEMAAATDFQIQKLVLINSHPGLEYKVERTNRKIFEDEVVDKLETLSSEEFLAWWNGQALFELDRPLSELSPEKQKASIKLFNQWRLSNQKDFLPDLAANKARVLIIAGSQDRKYSALALEKLQPEGIKVRLVEGGHRLFQQQSELYSLLKEEGIL